jgi:esterase/lipase
MNQEFSQCDHDEHVEKFKDYCGRSSKFGFSEIYDVALSTEGTRRVSRYEITETFLVNRILFSAFAGKRQRGACEHLQTDRALVHEKVLSEKAQVLSAQSEMSNKSFSKGVRGLKFINRLIFPGPCPHFEECQNRKIENEKTFEASNRSFTYLHYQEPTNANGKLVVYYHGNAECLSLCEKYVAYMAKYMKADIVVPEYDGYYTDCVQCSERDCYELAKAVDEWISFQGYEKADVTVIGYSIGTGTATFMASELDYPKLTLVCPFTSIKDVAIHHHGVMGNFIRQRFDNLSKIKQYTGSLIVIHGEKDDKIPISHGVNLYRSCPSKNKQFVAVRKRGHILDPSDLVRYKPLLEMISK